MQDNSYNSKIIQLYLNSISNKYLSNKIKDQKVNAQISENVKKIK